MNCAPILRPKTRVVSSDSNRRLVRILDRYVLRESLPPFLLALVVFTFVLAIQPMLPEAQRLLAKNVPLPTVTFCLVLLLPQALGLTIPMAFLAAVLLALGRWSADHEAVALLACGVNPNRLLRPILVLATAAAALTAFVMIELIPDCNQKYREVTFQFFTQKTQTDIKARIYYEGLPGKVLYLLDKAPDGGWSQVLLADTSDPNRLTFDLAERGDLSLDPVRRTGAIVLTQANRYAPGDTPGTYSTSRVDSERFPVSSEEFFGTDGTLNLQRGYPEMHIGQLRELIRTGIAEGRNPWKEQLYLQQKFAFPVACFVLALVALPIGLHTRKEGRLTGMVLGLIVVLVYYGLQNLAEGQAGAHHIPPWSARWIPNLVLFPIGLAALWWRARTTGQGIQLKLPARLTATRPGGRGLAPGGSSARAAAVVIRLPRLGLPRPRLLDMYVFAKYARLIALSVGGLMALFYVATIIDSSQRFFKSQATGWMLLKYLTYQTPQYAYYVIPIAALVAAMATIGALTRTSELTVMRACGVSLYRVALPLVLCSFVWSGAMFALEEHVLAKSNRKAMAIEDIIRGRITHTQDVANRNWLAGPDGRLFYYEGFDVRQNILYGVNILDTATSPYRLVSHTFAKRVAYRAGTWTAEGGWIERFESPTTSSRETFGPRQLPLPARENFVTSQVSADEMTVGELRGYISRLDASGFSIAEQRVALQRKLAFPLITFVVTLIGVPFGITTGRRGALFGIGIGVGLSFGYWLIETFFVAAGSAALLPPVLAAWAANVLFLALAGVLILTART